MNRLPCKKSRPYDHILTFLPEKARLQIFIRPEKPALGGGIFFTVEFPYPQGDPQSGLTKTIAQGPQLAFGSQVIHRA
jgi:hypothetical protein